MARKFKPGDLVVHNSAMLEDCIFVVSNYWKRNMVEYFSLCGQCLSGTSEEARLCSLPTIKDYFCKACESSWGMLEHKIQEQYKGT